MNTKYKNKNVLIDKEISIVLNKYSGCACLYSIGFGEYRESIFICATDDNTFYHRLPNIDRVNPGMIKYESNSEMRQGVKLLLTHLKDISDDHAIEIADKIYTGNTAGVPPERTELIRAGKESVKRIINFFSRGSIGEPVSISVYLFLLSKGYAVPLWFGLDHWANGKHAIELGIGINKTEK